MAKTTGPLFSMDARGKFGGSLVYSGWKGRPTVRQLVIPANPMTAGQQTSRNRMRVIAAGQRFLNLTTLKRSGQTKTDKQELTAAAPAGQAWNGYFTREAIGSAGANYTDATAAYAALTNSNRTAWDTAAAALVPAITATPQKVAGGGAGAAIGAGETWFHACWGLFKAGITTQPGAVPPTYA